VDQSAGSGVHGVSVVTQGGTSGAVDFTVGDQTPVITSIYPSTWEAGQTYTDVTISGVHFGLNPQLGAGSDVQISVNGSPFTDDNTIHATVYVYPEAQTGQREVTVTSQGWSGVGFIATSGGGQQATGNANVMVLAAAASVAIASASIPGNSISLALTPSGVSGTLIVQLVGGGTHTLYNGAMSGGSQTIGFDIPNLPTGEFTGIQAAWTAGEQTVSSDPFSYYFKVLGDYNNTRYNTPTESYCTGSPVDVSYVSGTCAAADNCSFLPYQGKSGWWSEVYENGSGLSETPGIGAVSWEWFCTGAERRTRRVAAPCPQCAGQQLGVGTTVARNVNSSDLPCGAKLYVHGVGTVTVADAGGGLALNQLDHYAGFGGCNRVGGSIGVRKVIRLF
jgi:hypothetical protein